jgi:hypothetical protein
MATETENITINDSVAVIKNSVGTTLKSENILAQATENITINDSSVENSDATYSVDVLAQGSLTLPDSQINVNSVDSGDVVSVKTIDVNLEDSLGAPVVPTSVGLVGNTLTIEVPSGATPSGVLLQRPILKQYTSFANFDEGWRNQNGWNSAYSIPSNPEAIADLDYSLGSNYWWSLKDNLVVNGVSSKIRFVDVDGGQTWSSTGNKNLITIDKLTGIGIYRQTLSAVLWATHLINSDSLSIVVNGVTYNSFFLAANCEYISIFGFLYNNPISATTDQITGASIFSNANVEYLTATTRMDSSTFCGNYSGLTNLFNRTKGSSGSAMYIFDASSLITAP